MYVSRTFVCQCLLQTVIHLAAVATLKPNQTGPPCCQDHRWQVAAMLMKTRPSMPTAPPMIIVTWATSHGWTILEKNGQEESCTNHPTCLHFFNYNVYFSGISMACFSGVLFGFQFLPIELLRRCDNPSFSTNG